MDLMSEGNEDVMKPSYYWFVGLVIYLSGSLMEAACVNLQKYAMDKDQEEAKRKGVEPASDFMELVKLPLWSVGIVGYVVAGILMSGSLYFAPATLLTPLISSSIVFNMLLAKYLRKEKFSKYDVICISLIVVGLVFVVAGAPHDDRYYTPSQFKRMFFDNVFIVYISVCVLGIAFLLTVNWYGKRLLKQRLNRDWEADKHKAEAVSEKEEREERDVEMGRREREGNEGVKGCGEEEEEVGECPLHFEDFQIAAKDGPYVDSEWRCRKCHRLPADHPKEDSSSSSSSSSSVSSISIFEQMYPFSFAGLAGVFGGLTLIFMKSAIETIVDKLSRSFFHLISSAMVWVLTFLMGTTWVMQMYWVNEGLRNFSSVYICSVENAINQIIAAIGSIIYFKVPFESPVYVGMFVVGMAMGIAGVLLLSYFRRNQGDEDNPQSSQTCQQEKNP